jgi:hypothetical protein
MGLLAQKVGLTAGRFECCNSKSGVEVNAIHLGSILMPSLLIVLDDAQ